MSRLREKYLTEAVPEIQKVFGYKNPMAVPALVKVVLNMGLGEAMQNIKILDAGADGTELDALAASSNDVGRKPRSRSNTFYRRSYLRKSLLSIKPGSV